MSPHTVHLLLLSPGLCWACCCLPFLLWLLGGKQPGYDTVMCLKLPSKAGSLQVPPVGEVTGLTLIRHLEEQLGMSGFRTRWEEQVGGGKGGWTGATKQGCLLSYESGIFTASLCSSTEVHSNCLSFWNLQPTNHEKAKDLIVLADCVTPNEETHHKWMRHKVGGKARAHIMSLATMT